MARRFLQLALDFFGPGPVVPTGNPAGVEKTPVSVSNMPSDQVGQAQSAIEKVANPATLASAAFRHPRATREVLLDGKLVAFELKRRKRRTIGFSVGAEGLAVSAPKWVPLYEIDQAVQGKSGWIVKKLHETRERHHRLESARIDWKNGAVIPFLGQPLRLVVDSLQLHTALQPSSGSDAPVQTLCVGLSGDAGAEQIRLAVQDWLKQQARLLFARRLDHFAPQLGVQWRKLSLSSATTRWGSASASGAIRLNWRLMHLDQALIDYVVVHELSHLRVMDHSPRFWATVRRVIPDYAALRRQLREEASPH
jgi:predicted metal-dependent hydrolase